MGARDSTLCARTIGLVILMGRFIPVPLEKSPGRGGAGLVTEQNSMRILHGWQFACNVATGGKACRHPKRK